MQFYEISIFQVMICRFYTVYNKHKMITKMPIKPEKNCKYYRKCSINFAADCTSFIENSYYTTISRTLIFFLYIFNTFQKS